MKGLILGCVVMMCMTGCSFRDGASTTAASITSGAWSIVGIPYDYGDSKKYWDKKLAKKKAPTDSVVIGED